MFLHRTLRNAEALRDLGICEAVYTVENENDPRAFGQLTYHLTELEQTLARIQYLFRIASLFWDFRQFLMSDRIRASAGYAAQMVGRKIAGGLIEVGARMCDCRPVLFGELQKGFLGKVCRHILVAQFLGQKCLDFPAVGQNKLLDIPLGQRAHHRTILSSGDRSTVENGSQF